MKEEKQCYIRILTPVHIGCDEIYEPMGFVLDEENCSLTAFDPLTFYKGLSESDKKQYAQICKKGTVRSILELMEFMRGKSIQGYEVMIAPSLVNHYRKTLSLSKKDEKTIIQELNNFIIQRTAFNEFMDLPYLPGTSIKGSIRTAYLNLIANEKKTKRKYKINENKIMEIDLLDGGSFSTDPFRLVKVSDFMPESVSTKIIYAVNERKKISKNTARGPYQILEAIKPQSYFRGSISVDLSYAKEARIRSPLSFEKIFKSLNNFYKKERLRESNELKTAGLPDLREEIWENEVLIRIGRHCGAESVTVEGQRRIKIKKGIREFDISEKATTFWLVSDISKGYEKNQIQPFGWAALGLWNEKSKNKLKNLQVEKKEKTLKERITEIQKGDEKPFSTSPIEAVSEMWKGAYVSFNAGGGGIITATNKDGKKAEIRGKEKARNIIDDTLMKKLEKDKKVTEACVEVKKIGNGYEIIGIKQN